MDARRVFKPRWAVILVVVAWIPLTTGCVGFLAQIGYWTGGANVAAEFDDLTGKRVAVVCISDSGSFGLGTNNLFLARGVATILEQKIEEIEMVRTDEIADWIDRNDWDEVDFAEIGRGVEAERVVAIELSGFGLYDGQTLYKGRANMMVRVLDMEAGGKEVFRRRLDELAFPTNGGYPTTDTTESKFRRTFLKFLADNVAKFFYEYEMMEDFGRDPAFLG